MECLRVEIADAVVEQRSDQVGSAGLAGRILRGAAGESEIDGNHGTAGSCTSQASMPPGLTTRSMVVAQAGAAKSNER